MTFVLRPSNAWRWTHCPVSPHETNSTPHEETDAAREGTCAAWVAECVIRGDTDSCFNMIGQTHKNGWLVDDEMAADIQEYVDMLKSRGGELLAEIKVRLSEEPLIQGTLDAANIVVVNRKLFVDDLKYGRKNVEVFKCLQLLIYGGALFFFGADGKLRIDQTEIDEIQLGIYQPRSFHIDGIYRTWTVTPQQLLDYCNAIIEAGRNCLDPNAVAVAGDWCYGCPKALGCETFTNAYQGAVETIASSRHRQLTAEELSRELDGIEYAFEIIKARKNAIDTEAEARIKNGEHIPHYGLEPGRNGKRTWKSDVNPTVVELLTGLDIRDTGKLITPKKAQDMKMDEALLKSLVKQPKLPPKLARRNGSRADYIFNNKPGVIK